MVEALILDARRVELGDRVGDGEQPLVENLNRNEPRSSSTDAPPLKCLVEGHGELLVLRRRSCGTERASQIDGPAMKLVLPTSQEGDGTVVLGDELMKPIDDLGNPVVHIDQRRTKAARSKAPGGPPRAGRTRRIEVSSGQQSIPAVIGAEQDLAPRLLRTSAGVACHALDDRLDRRGARAGSRCCTPSMMSASRKELWRSPRLRVTSRTSCHVGRESPYAAAAISSTTEASAMG
ncbi:MAG TPA: hypothetical protein VMD59_21410 [Acidimicrobiales bacterium]|nr:hypothetical protein [Acidimicrobiales bacterium]